MSQTGPRSPRSDAPGLARFPSTSTIAGLSPSSSPVLPRTTSRTAVPRKRRNLLRDYYGLDDSKPKGQDPLNLDSPSFDARAYYDHLANSLTLPELLRRETDLLDEIRELDSERQSLVYNHHHELIEASDTIRKMKARAESLDGALDSLTASLETITQLSESLAANPPPLGGKKVDGAFDPLVHLPPLLNLPTTLRSLLDTSPSDRIQNGLLPLPMEGRRRAGSLATSGSSRDDANRLWGEWEPALRAWEVAGIEGVKEIGDECRAILARARRASVSVAKG